MGKSFTRERKQKPRVTLLSFYVHEQNLIVRWTANKSGYNLRWMVCVVAMLQDVPRTEQGLIFDFPRILICRIQQHNRKNI